MPWEVFVDESMRQEYLLAAVLVDPRDLKAARGALRAMLLPGERRLHFSKEHDGRRRDLLARFCAHGFRVMVYVTAVGRTAREHLLHTLAADTRDDLHRLVIESRGAGDIEDRRLLVRLQRAGGFPDRATYEHLAPHEEPLLWVADGVAWAWGSGGDWRRRAAPLVAGVRRIDP